MTSPTLALWVIFLFCGEMTKSTEPPPVSSVHQENGFVSADIGDEVTLRCFQEGNPGSIFYWYKQPLGEKPKIISTYYKYETKGKFHDEFESSTRFTLDTTIGHHHMTITDLRLSDTATYYCACGFSYKFEFMEGTTLIVKGSLSNLKFLVNQPRSETARSGDSVNLNCTVQTGTSAGEHSVYWFKDSETSQPGLVYIQGDGNNQCERKADQQTCDYQLAMESLNRSHSGTYYCAVISCGHILFGNGTKLDLIEELNALTLVYVLSGALTFTIIYGVLLTFYMCVINKRNSRNCKESCAGNSVSATNEQAGQNEDNIHYAALKEHRVNRSRRQVNNIRNECVYSSIK